MPQENIFGIVPNTFEPEYLEEPKNLTAYNNSDPIIPTFEEWCSDGQCEVMPTFEKCMWYKNCDYTAGDLGERPWPIQFTYSKSRCSFHCFYLIYDV